MLYKFNQLIKALTKKELTALLISAAVFAVSVSIWGVYLFITKTVESPAVGGTWREGIVGQPVFINPVISGNDADQDISRLIFASLNDLSESIKPDNSGRVWTVRLREGLKWHDGQKITSDDIVFTFDTITNPQAHSPLAPGFDGSIVTRISELETKFELPSAYVFFDTTLKNLRPIPKHIFGNIPPANFYLSSFVTEPIGSGTYRYKSYKKQKDGFISEYALETNRSYSGGKPYIKSFIFRFYRDEASIIKAYNRGEIDGFATFNPSIIEKITVRKDIKTISAPRYYAVFWNPALNAVFKDKSVRQALSSVISRDEIVGKVFSGLAEPAYGPTPESTLEKKEFPSVIDRISFDLTVPDIKPLIEMAEIIRSDWEKLGVSVSITPMRSADVQEEIKNRSYEALLFGNILNEPQDLYSFWHSSKRFYPGLNLAMFNNRDLDSLLDDARTELDPEKRAALVQSAAKIISDESAAAFVIFPKYVYITSPRIKGFNTASGTVISDRLNDVSDWYLATVRKFR